MTFDFKGYTVKMYVGVNSDPIEIVLTHDDGTSGNHIIVKMNDIPYANIPIVNKDGLHALIEGLKKLEDMAFKDK